MGETLQQSKFQVDISHAQKHIVQIELEMESSGFTQYYTKVREALAKTRELQNGPYNEFFEQRILENYLHILERILISETPVKSGVIREYANKNGVNWIVLARMYFGNDERVNHLYLQYLDLHTPINPRNEIENEIPRALRIILEGIEGVDELLSLERAPTDIPRILPQILQ